jgi:hypothetical protein
MPVVKVPLDLPGLPDLKDRLGLRAPQGPRENRPPRQTPNRQYYEAASVGGLNQNVGAVLIPSPLS